jgi:hypothetical protein
MNMTGRKLLIGALLLEVALLSCARRMPDSVREQAHRKLQQNMEMVERSLTFEFEQELEIWHPDQANAPQPDPKLIYPQMEIADEWKFATGFFGTKLSISTIDDGYRARFHMWGCVGTADFERKATFSNGIISLDRPVMDFWPNKYQQLYSLRVQGTDFLVPSPVLSQFEDMIASGEVLDCNSLPQVLHRISKPLGPNCW